MPSNSHCCCLFNIECLDGDLAECMAGACMKMTIAGVTNGNVDCDEAGIEPGCSCDGANRTYYFPIDSNGNGAGWGWRCGIWPCRDGHSGSIGCGIAIEVYDFHSSPDSEILTGCAGGGWFYLHASDFGEGPGNEWPTYEAGRAAINALLTTLCSGGTVTLECTPPASWNPLTWTCGCSYLSATATLELVRGECPDPPGPEPDPDPEPDPPYVDCDAWESCTDDHQMNLALFNFVDCTIENTVDHPYLEEWFWGSLNTTDAIGYTLEAVTSVDPSLVLCSVPIVATNFILPLGDYTSVDSNDRLADPGLLIGQETYPEFKLRKYYLCAILVLTECNVNEVTNVAEVNISEVRFLIQFWDFAWDTDHFETTPFIYGGVICLVNAGVENLSNTVAAPAGPCCTFNRGMSRVFEYDNCGETKLFKAVGLMPCD